VTYRPFLTAALALAQRGGALLFESFGKGLEASRKGAPRDIVTAVDLAIEREFREGIVRRFPGHGVWGEEEGREGAGSEFEWIVDPVDGTVNFTAGIPLCAVCLALRHRGRIVLGVVHNPFTREFYYAARGLGAWLNQDRIKVGGASNLSEAVLACAFSSKATPDRDLEFRAFGELNDLSRGCLRTGSAAINFAYVASGRLGGAWGRGTKIWDIAAGVVLVEEAAGKVTFLEEDPRNGRLSASSAPGAASSASGRVTLAASNPSIHDALLERLRFERVAVP